MAFPETKPIPEMHHDILVDGPIGHLATIHPEQVSAPEIPRAKAPPSAPGSESRDDGS